MLLDVSTSNMTHQMQKAVSDKTPAKPAVIAQVQQSTMQKTESYVEKVVRRAGRWVRETACSGTQVEEV